MSKLTEKKLSNTENIHGRLMNGPFPRSAPNRPGPFLGGNLPVAIDEGIRNLLTERPRRVPGNCR
jgi:hypothetical protein